jgi:exodeoxyribonuclease-1
VAFPLTSGKNGNVVVYDLRYDPTPFIDLDSKELAKKLYATWEERQKEDFVKLPVKELQPNRVPAVAPLGVLQQGDGWERIHLTPDVIEKHKTLLLRAPHFAENIRGLFENRAEFKKSPDPEAQLYDGFVSDRDRLRIEAVRNATERELADFHPDFTDERLAPLLLHYKARNYPMSLSEDEARAWETWRAAYVGRQLPQFVASLNKLAHTTTDEGKQFILQELQLWAESIISVEDINQEGSE